MNDNESRLTVIIPFLNEADEVRNTVANLRETAAGPVDILLINDASNDGYDYKSVAEAYGARYVEHRHRAGVAASRDEGVALSATDYVLLLDGHMRFPETGWDDLLLRYLPTDHRAIWSGNTLVMNREADGTVAWKETTPSFGAYMLLDDEAWGIEWNRCDPAPGEEVCDVSCILGACYAFHKAYWRHLGGLEGLQQYGLDEQLISYKAWMEGGRCKLIKSLKAGHLYRKSFPYKMPDNYVERNRLFLTELLLDGAERDAFRRLIVRRNGAEIYMRFAEALNRQAAALERMRGEIKALQRVPFEEIAARNRAVARRNKTA